MPRGAKPWFRFIAYVPWVMWQIAIANIRLVRVVLHPKLPIQPQVLKFKAPLPNLFAQVTLANSITLTPGTVTLDVDEHEYVVHALTNEAARSIRPSTGEGEMQKRVTKIMESNGG